MYLLYLDESGTQSDARQYEVAGVAIHESSVYWPTDALNRLETEYFPNAPAGSVQFHATHLRGNPSRRIPAVVGQLTPAVRQLLLDNLYEIMHGIHCRIFAVVIEKDGLADGEDPYVRALEEMLYRFDRFLNRMYRERKRRGKGMVIIADSPYRSKLETVGQQFISSGTRWGKVYNLLEIPFFTLSRNSRPLQIADLVANTVYGRYENGHAGQFDRLLPKFYQSSNGPLHGLVHLPAESALCYQPCCWPQRHDASRTDSVKAGGV